MHPDWFKIPIFFSNANAVYGHKASIPYPKMTRARFWTEFAVIIANSGSDIDHNNADNYIADTQLQWLVNEIFNEEMAMSLGPAKGKDFATSFGPI